MHIFSTEMFELYAMNFMMTFAYKKTFMPQSVHKIVNLHIYDY